MEKRVGEGRGGCRVRLKWRQGKMEEMPECGRQ